MAVRWLCDYFLVLQLQSRTTSHHHHASSSHAEALSVPPPAQLVAWNFETSRKMQPRVVRRVLFNSKELSSGRPRESSVSRGCRRFILGEFPGTMAFRSLDMPWGEPTARETGSCTAFEHHSTSSAWLVKFYPNPRLVSTRLWKSTCFLPIMRAVLTTIKLGCLLPL